MGDRYGLASEFLDFVRSWRDRISDMPEEDAANLEELSKKMLSRPGLKPNKVAIVQDVAEGLRDAINALKYPPNCEDEIYTDGFKNIYEAANNAEVLLDRIQFGTNLRRLRLVDGLNLTELAEKADIDLGYASKLENFVSGPASIEVAARLASVLSTSISALWDGYTPFLNASTTAGARPSTEQSAIIAEIVATCEEIPEDQLKVVAAALRAVADLARQERRKREQAESPIRVQFA